MKLKLPFTKRQISKAHGHVQRLRLALEKVPPGPDTPKAAAQRFRRSRQLVNLLDLELSLCNTGENLRPFTVTHITRRHMRSFRSSL